MLCSWARCLLSRYLSLYPGVLNGSWGHPAVDYHPIQGRIVASYYRIQDKLWPDGPLGSYVDSSGIGKAKPANELMAINGP